MPRYHLDDLGWFQFESLIQSLLKAELGIGIESWGGPGDQGRDAYFDGPLRYPTGDREDGPFLFQVKFVQDANASGATPAGAILRAVRTECRRIAARISHDTWGGANHYILLTNVQPSPKVRTDISTALTRADPRISVHIHGADDVCDMLDRHPSLRKAFPQLLSIRDLDSLISDALIKDVRERSRIACASALDLAPVFVPTTAYERAWRVLQRHRFAVLEGPPEMGKTAIAWMITIVQLLQGWEAIACNGPDHFFRCIERERHQVFVADDAFGRTEYDPARGRRWETDLHRVVRALDSRHWLIWTSRKHILERAVRDLDLQGRAKGFPAPGAVLVDASHLTTSEKALMLYRHAKAAALTADQVGVVKSHASLIAHHSSFTPERIRRFVIGTLPGCAQRLQQEGASAVRAEIEEAIRNPTDRMRRTFARLALSHKRVLVAMLDCGDWPDEVSVHSAYEALGADESQGDFVDIIEELRESFIDKKAIGRSSSSYLVWMHPSYRDLVIEELSRDASRRREFLGTCSMDGLKLAVSQVGGAAGTRQFPFMVDEEAWTTLTRRAADLVAEASVDGVCDILTSVVSALGAVGNANTREKLERMLTVACEAAREKWDSRSTPLSGQQLTAFADASIHLPELPKLPDLKASWDNAECGLYGELSREECEPLKERRLVEWSALVAAVGKVEPRFMAKVRFPLDYGEQMESLFTEIREELENRYCDDDPDLLEMDAERLAALGSVVDRLSDIPGDHVEIAIELHNRLVAAAMAMREQAAEGRPPEPDEEEEGHAMAGFDVAALFSDL